MRKTRAGRIKALKGEYEDIVFDDVEFRRGKVTGPDRRRGVWQKIEEEVYATCPRCRAINRITHHVGTLKNPLIWPDGYFDGCITCVHCGGHFCSRLVGWKGFARGRCESCDRVMKGFVREFKRWDSQGLFCPKCHRDEGTRT